MIFRRLFLLSLSLSALLTPIVQGQTFKAFVKAGEEALEREDYQAAMQHFAGALQQRPEAAGVAFQYAEVARRFHAYEAAEQHYLQVLESDQAARFTEALYGLGKVYQQQGEYGKAIRYLQAYLNQDSRPPRQREAAERALIQANWAKVQPQKNERWKVEHMGRRANTGYSEFAPLLYNDTLYYSSFRYDMEEDDYQPSRKITHVLILRGRGRGRPLRRGFNAENRHTAHTAISLDGGRMYFTYCDYVSASEIRCQLYYRERDSRGRWARKARALPAAVNREGYTATHPAIGYDSVRQSEVLFFVSEGEGQQLDLFVLPIDSSGAFGQPEALQELNSGQAELTPFFHSPTQTLYFSSDSRENFGGYDIFRARRQAKGWGKPENLGFPFNTSYNDLYYSLNPSGKSGFLASNRPGSFYLDDDNKACCNDLYKFTYIPPPPPDTPTVAEIPEAPPAEPEEPMAEPEPPSTLQDFLPLALYFDNDRPDPRTRRSDTKKTYGATYESYYQRQAAYLKAFAEPLQGERAEEAAYAVETFFEEEVQKGYEYLLLFSDILLERLRRGDQVEIFMKGYTSPRAKSSYNLSLSKRRISSVRNHFRTYQDGVFLPYLENGQLQLSERPFGEAEASNEVSDALDDLRNSIYHPDAARERRVEILQIREE